MERSSMGQRVRRRQSIAVLACFVETVPPLLYYLIHPTSANPEIDSAIFSLYIATQHSRASFSLALEKRLDISRYAYAFL